MRVAAAFVLTQIAALTFAGAAPAQAPLAEAKTVLAPFETSPFPYTGEVPEKNIPFLDVHAGERRGHTAPRGGVYWEEQTYRDRRSLLFIPRGFDLRRAALIVVYLTRNLARLARGAQHRRQVHR